MNSAARLRQCLLFPILLSVAATASAGSLLAGNLGLDLRNRIDAVFNPWNRSDSPGCSLAVVDQGRIIYERGYGMANLDHGIAITPETVFYVGSVSKQFTAASVALMASQGKLDLDADIRTYVPEMPAYAKPISVRQLIHHTSGIRDIYTLMRMAGKKLEDVFPDRQALDLISRQQELNFTPGSENLYSNSGYFLLSEIVERLSQSSLREYANQNIFLPLDMRDTHFHDSPGHVQPRTATSYQPGEEGSFRNSFLSNFDKVGAGGLYSTVRDLYKWDQNFYSGQVGGESFLETIQTGGKLSDGTQLEYAFGLRVSAYRGLPIVAHGGSMMGFKADYVQFPKQQFSLLCLCNLGSINPTRLTRQVADIYLADHFTDPPPEATSTPRREGSRGPAPTTVSNSQIQALLGSYVSPELETSLQIARSGNGLLVRRTDGSETPLVPLSDGKFRMGTITLRVIPHADGSVRELRLDAGRARHFLFLPRPE